MNIKDTTTFGPVQILMLKGEQGEPGKPTDEQVTSAVNAWLDEHPEATTTVQDKSITIQKLANDVYAAVFIGDDSEITASYTPNSSEITGLGAGNALRTLLAGRTLKEIKKVTVKVWAQGNITSIDFIDLYLRNAGSSDEATATRIPAENYTLSSGNIIEIEYDIPANMDFALYAQTNNVFDRIFPGGRLVSAMDSVAIRAGMFAAADQKITVGGTSPIVYDYTIICYGEKRQSAIELIDALTTRVDALDVRVTASSGNGLTFEPDFEPLSAAEGLVATKVGSVCNISGSIMPTSDVVVSSASVVASFDSTEFVSPRGIYAPAYIIGMGAVPKLAFWIVGGIISLSTISGDPVTIPAGTRIVLNTTWLE